MKVPERELEIIRENAEAMYFSQTPLGRRVTYEIFEVLARFGDPRGTWCLGEAYLEGVGVRRNRRRAFRLLEKASKMGVPEAKSSLGVLLWDAGSTAGRRRAVGLYRESASAGEPNALHNLGVCYSTGTVVEANDRPAYNYFLQAARRGHMEAAFKVGYCLDAGLGVRQNSREARRWLKRAARAGNSEALRFLRNRKRKGKNTR